MLALADILTEAGLPDGVVNCVTTIDAGAVMEPLIRSGRARKLSFTGSTAVGRMLLEQCADKVMRTSMELGGNAPFLVFEDADLDEAVEGAMRPRCATSARPAPPPTGSTCTPRSSTSSVAAWLSGWRRCPSAAASRTASWSAR